jgi:hypothetical protein
MDSDHDDTQRLPAVRSSSAPVPAHRAAELVRAAPMMAAPMMLTAAVQATASAMTEVMAQMMRPWLLGVPVVPPPAQEWSGPGVHVSYTHVEMRWPAR